MTEIYGSRLAKALGRKYRALENERALRLSDGVEQSGWGNVDFVTVAYLRKTLQLWLYCGVHGTTILDEASSTVLHAIFARVPNDGCDNNSPLWPLVEGTATSKLNSIFITGIAISDTLLSAK